MEKSVAEAFFPPCAGPDPAEVGWMSCITVAEGSGPTSSIGPGSSPGFSTMVTSFCQYQVRCSFRQLSSGRSDTFTPHAFHLTTDSSHARALCTRGVKRKWQPMTEERGGGSLGDAHSDREWMDG
ncbi:hypothetical protein CDAR_546451 [Caerostris darwini]|uniref:Uncharacterized protein n=1 Tax=Caerostris darwini TaxID=1538125 RepID=A0AAV4M3A4_9ARAC|nr:hypothetical protein CDAR_546451 [Caerostris darwini]